jgi:hypothetical protein
MAGGIMLFGPEYGSYLKNPTEYAYHHLLIDLRALCQTGGLAEIIQLKNVCAALSTG